MSLRTAVIRTSAKRGVNPSLRTVAQPMARRQVGGTSTPPHNKNSPDLKWIIGSAVLVVPVAYYYTGRRAVKHGDNIAKDASKDPIGFKTGEGSSKETGHAGFGGSGASAAQPNAKDGSQPVGQSEAKDVAESMKQAFAADAPKTAYRAEEEQARKKQ